MNERHEFSPGELHELAPSYALGALDDAERAAFEDHLRKGCVSCRAELKSFAEVTDEMAAAAAVEPPPSLREKLLSSAARSPRVPGLLLQQAGVLVSRPDELPWRRLGKGIAMKALFTDNERRYRTCLIRMDPGARYPRHRHNDVEELFLLSGDLHIAGESMRAGDYCRAAANTVHAESFTESGCIFLVMASQSDQVEA